jgi:radical SAM superfamily enzyme YgiQ (UPF0313 family)
MKRILLINANRFKQPWPVIPIGLCSVAAVLEQAGHEVHFLDLCFSKECSSDIRRSIETLNPEIVGVGIRNIDNSAAINPQFLLDETKREVIVPVKECFRGPLVIGGPSVGISGAEMLQHLDLEYAIRGDGELAMGEFVKRFESGGESALVGLKGLVIRKKDVILQDLDPWPVEDLNSLPLVRPHRYVDWRAYRRFSSPIQIQTKRGCALRCTYCTYNRIEGCVYRYRRPELIAEHIETLVRETGIKNFEFVDSAFNIPLDHAKAVLRALVKKRLDLRLRTMGLNPGGVDEELADLLKEAGFTDVDLGAESGSDVTLKGLGKNFTKKDILKAARLLQERGISITWYLLLGAPGETLATLQETFDMVNRAASKWDIVNMGVGVRVYNGAPMAEVMKAENPQCSPDNFLHPIPFEPRDIRLDTIKVITKHEALRRPNYYMYDEDENIPLFVTRIGATLMKWFAPRQPIWKLLLVIKKIQNLIGISFLKRLLFSLKHRKHLDSCH